MMSLPLVPLTMTASAAASPVVPPMAPARFTLTVVRSVPERLLTVTVSAPPSVLRSIASTSLRSMTMLATLRVNSTRPPFAETLKISLAALPLNSIRSVPPLSFDGVVAVTRIPLEHIVSGTQECGVVALLPVDEVVAVAAAQVSRPRCCRGWCRCRSRRRR